MLISVLISVLISALISVLISVLINCSELNHLGNLKHRNEFGRNGVKNRGGTQLTKVLSRDNSVTCQFCTCKFCQNIDVYQPLNNAAR